MKKQNFIRRLIDYIQRLFIKGLLTILPLTLTGALFIFSFRLVKGWLSPLSRFLATYATPELYLKIPHFEIVVAIGFILTIGAILQIFLLHPLISWAENILGKIPLLRQVYFGIKQLIHAFTAHDKYSFQRVVLIEFPRVGTYSFGFVTSKIPAGLSPSNSISYLSVFVPTTPNPTTGFYIMAPEHECKNVDLTRHEAMAIIISGGIIQPERFVKE
ncbi:MAG TPA: DUF502 domain-containing protein [Candidatus Babeliaceae bacterium]|nr:DUF502 domain-containing protein [Candidatus Babeliaceae bacterium]